MACRVTPTEVIGIMDTDLTRTTMQPFVDLANAMVNEHLLGEGIGNTTLEKIELQLSAHFASAFKDRMAESQKLGDASIKYIGKFDMGLDLTPYGQMAKSLDPTGILSEIDMKPTEVEVVHEVSDA